MQGAVDTYLREGGRNKEMKEGRKKDLPYSERMKEITDLNAEAGVELPTGRWV